MQTMRYINILDRTSRVKTTKCFNFNNTILFAVPRAMVSQAIGPGASNIRNMQETLGKRIKIIAEANGTDDAVRFLNDVIEPIKFKSLEIKDNQLIITAGSMQNKAALMGRNKTRFAELELIIKDTFHLEFKLL